jgi:hypothetical protein
MLLSSLVLLLKKTGYTSMPVAGQINKSIHAPHSHRKDPSFSQRLPEAASC